MRTRKPTIGIFEASIAAAIQLLPIQKSYPKQNAHDPGEYVKTADQEEHAQHGMTKEAKEETSTFAKFGIVSTGAIWKEVLTTAIQSSHPGMLGSLAFGLFAGVETIGLDAGDLHPPSPPSSPPLPTTAPSYSSTTTTSVPTAPQTIEQKVRSAARRLLQAGDVGVVVLGCAGMVGMDTWVRAEMEGCIGKAGRVIDGVKAGVGILQGLVRTFED